MKERLVVLFIIKTEESRIEAQKEIDKWHKAVNIVFQAESRADCKIDLQPTLMDSISKAAEDAYRVDYVGAIGLIKKATDERLKLIQISKRRFEAEIESRRTFEKSIASEMKRAVKQRDEAVSQVNSTFQAAIGKKPELSTLIGCTLGCFSYIVISSLTGVVFQYMRSKNITFEYLSDNYVLIGVLILTLLLWVLLAAIFNRTQVQAWENNKRQKEREKNEEISILEQDAKRRLPSLNERHQIAERQLKKAEDALRLLVEQTQGLV
jgi:hypothetical protein